ncbi:biotin/lipoyl-containing protein, partial [Paenarthrobacter sp. RAF9]
LYGFQHGEEHVIELEKGVRLIAQLEAVSEADEKGMRTVMCTLNGQSRPVVVRDRSVVSNVKAAEKADPAQPGQVAAPFAGAVTVTVKAGDVVNAGDTVATIEAMKMEASITTPVAGTVSRLAISSVEQVQGGDLLLVIG